MLPLPVSEVYIWGVLKDGNDKKKLMLNIEFITNNHSFRIVFLIKKLRIQSTNFRLDIQIINHSENIKMFIILIAANNLGALFSLMFFSNLKST